MRRCLLVALLLLGFFLFCFVFCFFCFVLFCLVFWDTVSLYSPGCPGTHFVDQAVLELRNPPASASQVLGLKARATTPSEPFLIEPYILYFSILRLCLIKTIIMRVNTGQRLCWLSFYFFCQCITLKTRSKSNNILKQNIIKNIYRVQIALQCLCVPHFSLHVQLNST